MKNKKTLNRFYEETGIKLEEKNGNPYYGGSLYLRGTGITGNNTVNRNASK